MITSKLSSKAQTTIPQAVRAALRLKEGDVIAYAIEADGGSCCHVRCRNLRQETHSQPSPNGTAKRTVEPMPIFKLVDIIREPFPRVGSGHRHR
nr:type II toxin-antitoxin system PrlF family antitoxin [Rhizobium wuzhouense]